MNRVTAPGELLPAALKLAQDIASCDPAAAQEYKAMIDEGFALPFDEAMAMERERSQAHRARVTGEAVAGRVDAVVARGKAQSRQLTHGPRRRPWRTASARRPVRR